MTRGNSLGPKIVNEEAINNSETEIEPLEVDQDIAAETQEQLENEITDKEISEAIPLPSDSILVEGICILQGSDQADEILTPQAKIQLSKILEGKNWHPFYISIFRRRK